MITTAILTDWIKHPESLNRDTLYQLRTAMERYPFFSSLRLLYLKNLYLLHDDTFGAELRKSAIYVADRRILFYLIEGERYKIAEQEHTGAPDTVTDEEPELDRTLSLIDHFLEEKPKDAEPKPAQPVNYATDYVAYLMQQEEQNPTPADATAPKSHSEELIDGFISDNHGEFKLTPESPDEQEAEPKGPNLDFMDEDEDCFTETLAKIYIKQRRYSKALEIIRKLYLKNPKKNVYFADQIRFLEKLIINEKQK